MNILVGECICTIKLKGEVNMDIHTFFYPVTNIIKQLYKIISHLWPPLVKTRGIVGLTVSSTVTGHRTNSPGSQAGWDEVVLLLSEAFDVLFRCTLERPFCHINQSCSECQTVFCQSEGPCLPDNDLLGRKVAIFVVATFCWTPPADVS